MVDLVGDTLVGYLIGPVLFFGVTFTIGWGVLRWRKHSKQLTWQRYQHKRQMEFSEAIDRWYADPNHSSGHPTTIEMEDISGCRRHGK